MMPRFAVGAFMKEKKCNRIKAVQRAQEIQEQKILIFKKENDLSRKRKHLEALKEQEKRLDVKVISVI